MSRPQKSYTLFTFDAGGKLLVARGLVHYTHELEPFGFIRCHNSYLVNRKYIRKIVNSDAMCELQLKNGLSVPVSHRYYKTIKNRLQESIRFWPMQFQDEKK